MTAKQIVHGLRCSATYRGDPVCDGCPYLVTETVPDSLRKLTKKNTWDICDVDRIALDAADLIEKLVTRIAELEAKAPRWIPVTERLPKKQAWYHVAIRDKKTMRVSVELDLYAVETAKNFGHEIGFCKANRWPEREELIAWMPLPEAPKEDE